MSGRSLHRSWRTGADVWVADVRLEDGHLTGRLLGPDGEETVDAHVHRTAPDAVRVRVDGRTHRAVLARRGSTVWVAVDGHVYELVAEDAGDRSGGSADPYAVSPMTGVVVKVNVVPGDTVAAGGVFVVEAMKMEYSVKAPRDVTVSSVQAAAGDKVDQGDPVVSFEDEA